MCVTESSVEVMSVFAVHVPCNPPFLSLILCFEIKTLTHMWDPPLLGSEVMEAVGCL